MLSHFKSTCAITRRLYLHQHFERTHFPLTHKTAYVCHHMGYIHVDLPFNICFQEFWYFEWLFIAEKSNKSSHFGYIFKKKHTKKHHISSWNIWCLLREIGINHSWVVKYVKNSIGKDKIMKSSRHDHIKHFKESPTPAILQQVLKSMSY